MSCEDLAPVLAVNGDSVILQYDEWGQCKDTSNNEVNTVRFTYSTSATAAVNFVPIGTPSIPTASYTDCSVEPPAPERDAMNRYFKITFTYPGSTGEHGWDFGTEDGPTQLQIRVRVTRV